MDRNYDVITGISKYFFRRSRVVNYIDIIKIATMIIQTTFKDPKIVTRIRKYLLQCNLYLYFLM